MIRKNENILAEIDIEDKKTLEDEVFIKENNKAIMNLLNELNEKEKEIFIMKYFMGMKAEDIGQKLNLTKSAVDSKIYRAKKILREKAVKLRLEVI